MYKERKNSKRIIVKVKSPLIYTAQHYLVSILQILTFCKRGYNVAKFTFYTSVFFSYLGGMSYSILVTSLLDQHFYI